MPKLIKKNITLNGNNSEKGKEIYFQRILKVYNTLNMAALISIPQGFHWGFQR